MLPVIFYGYFKFFFQYFKRGFSKVMKILKIEYEGFSKIIEIIYLKLNSSMIVCGYLY